MLDELEAYLPPHIRPFAEQLRQFPEGYEKWVYASAAPEEVYQGDVFSPMPFVAVGEDGETIGLTALVMVISNSCDAQQGNSNFVLFAPVWGVDDYAQDSELGGSDLENHIRALKDNKLSQYMFLPARSEMVESFVDFGNICSISLDYFYSRNPVRERLTSLSQYGHYVLLIKLAYHLSRPEPPDAKRMSYA